MSEGNVKRYQDIEMQPYEQEPVPIVHAGISLLDPESKDKYFVSFLVDLSNRQDLLSLIEAHRSSEGECTTVWFTPPGDEKVFNLLLSFTTPVEAKAILSFDILRHGAVVDCLMNGQGRIRLISGTKGEDLQKVLTERRPAIEIPVGARVEPDRWESLWSNTVARALEISSEQATNLIMLWRSETRLRVANPDIPPLNQLAGLFLDQERKQVVFVTKQLLTNHLYRDGPKIAESFDRFFGKETEELSEELSALLAATLPGFLQAARSGDRLVLVCGQLVENSLDGVIAALELLRLGHRLQPGIQLRTAIEGAAVAAHLYHKPENLGRFLAGKLDSSKIVGEARSVVPFIAQFWGFLSNEYTHLGPLHRQLDPSTDYKSADDAGAKTSLMSIHLVLIIVSMVAELVFFDSFSEHRYWTRISPGQYALDIRPEMRNRMQEIAERLSLKDA